MGRWVLVLAAGTLLFSGAFNLTYDWVPPRLTARLAATIVVTWASIAFVGQLLGVVGWLHAGWFHGILALLGWGMHRSPVTTGEGSTAMIRLAPRRRRRGRITVSVLIAATVAHVFLHALVAFPKDWDSLAYHLPIVDHWIQTGSLLNQRCAFWYVPGNNELLTYWWVSGLSGDFLAGLTNLPVVLLLVCVTNEALIAARCRGVLRLAAVTALLSGQLVFRQLLSQENDLAVGTLTAAGTVFGWQFARTGRRGGCVLFALSIGLLAGTKYFALGYAFVVTGLVAGAAYFSSRWRRAAESLGAAAAASAALSASWYVRNWVLAGTPLYPKGYEFLGMPDLWAQMRPGNAQSSLRGGADAEILRKLSWAWLEQSGPLVWVAVNVSGLVAAAIVGWFAARRLRHWHRGGDANRVPRRVASGRDEFLMFLACVTLGSFGVYAHTPNVIETVLGSQNMLELRYHSVRFGFALAVVATWLLIAMIGRVRVGVLRKSLIGLCSFLVILGLGVRLLAWSQMLVGLRDVGIKLHAPPHIDPGPLIWLVLTLDFFLVIAVLDGVKYWTPLRRASMVAIFALLTTGGVGYLAHRWHEGFEPFYEKAMRLPVGRHWRSLVEKPHETTVLACWYRYYPLLGSRRQVRVARPLYLPEPSDVRRSILRWNADVLIAPKKDRHWTKAYTSVWPFIQEHPQAFKERARVDYYIYARVKREQLTLGERQVDAKPN